ncbi:MAG: LysM peptidoglycan-binding domain-containing protein [Candidatus Auribacterota bacterium]|nr:LysM peptidoglycan-binding domain-containing protein [Candidatus Auribacterota bacterium]
MNRKKTVIMVMSIHFAAILMIGYISGCASDSNQYASAPRARIRDDFGQHNYNRSTDLASSYSSSSQMAQNNRYSSPDYDYPSQSSKTMMATTGYTTHVVQKGETLYAIGRKYNVSHSEIAAANSMNNPNNLNSGQVLRIPVYSSSASSGTMIAKQSAPAATKQADTTTQVAKKETKSEAMPSYKPVSVSAVHGTPTYAIHVVQSGENLGRIAKKYDVSVQSICSINGIDQSSALNEGDRIKIPVN